MAQTHKQRVEEAQKHFQALRENARYSLDLIKTLINGSVAVDQCTTTLARLRSRDFEDIIEERTDVKELCGMPTCANSIAKTRSLQYLINPLKLRVEQNVNRGRYCCTRCFEQATHILQILDNSLPLARTEPVIRHHKSAIEKVLSATKSNIQLIYGDAKESARYKAEAERPKDIGSDTTTSPATTKVKVASTSANTDTKPKPQPFHLSSQTTSTASKATKDNSLSLNYLADNTDSDDDNDDEQDFEVDGGLGAGSLETATAALTIYCGFGKTAPTSNKHTVRGSTTTISQPEPHNSSTSSEVAVQVPLPKWQSPVCQPTEPSDVFVRVDSTLKRWLTTTTFAMCAKFVESISGETLVACGNLQAKHSTATLTDDVLPGVLFGPLDHQKRTVLHDRLASFFSRYRIVITHRKSGTVVDQSLALRIVRMLVNSFQLPRARPIPGFQPVQWHLITLALLVSAGCEVRDQTGSNATSTAQRSLQRIFSKSKLTDYELSQFLSPDYWQTVRSSLALGD